MSELLSYRPSNSAIYYTPDKRVDVGRTCVSFLVAAGLAAAGGIGYARIYPHLDNFIGRAAATVVAALAVGCLGLIPVKRGRVRIPLVSASLGTALSLFTLYVIWIAWVEDVLVRFGAQFSAFDLILHPIVFGRLVVKIGEFGTWTSHGNVVRGPVLYALWILESSAVLALGVLIPAKSLYTSDPACKSCRTRCVRTPAFPRFSIRRQPEFLSAVENRRFDALADHLPPENEDAPELSVKLMSCPKCHETQVLTISQVGWHREKGGRLVVKIIPQIEQLLLTPDEAERLSTVMKTVRDRRAVQLDAVVPAVDAPADDAPAASH